MLPFTGLAQKDTNVLYSSTVNLNEEKGRKLIFNNQIDLDLEMLAVSFSYKRKLYRNWFLGPNVGLGLGIHYVSWYGKLSAELLHLGIGLKYIATNNIQFELEPRMSVFGSGFDDIIGAPGIGFGGYWGDKIQFGIRTMIGVENGEIKGGKMVFSSSLIIVRIPVRW